MTRVPDATAQRLMAICEQVVRPLFAQVVADAETKLEFDNEFAQCLWALDERGALHEFFEQGACVPKHAG